MEPWLKSRPKWLSCVRNGVPRRWWCAPGALGNPETILCFVVGQVSVVRGALEYPIYSLPGRQSSAPVRSREGVVKTAELSILRHHARDSQPADDVPEPARENCTLLPGQRVSPCLSGLRDIVSR